MHPAYHSYWHHTHRRCRPSRLLWFALGGIAATFYWKADDCVQAKESSRAAKFYYGHCYRPSLAGIPENRDTFLHKVNSIPAPEAEILAEVPVPAPTGVQSPPIRERWGAKSQREWDEDKARFTAMTQQATDAMTEISEATLDNILSTVEHLKAKLAQQRAIRELQRKELAAMAEREKEVPERWV